MDGLPVLKKIFGMDDVEMPPFEEASSCDANITWYAKKLQLESSFKCRGDQVNNFTGLSRSCSHDAASERLKNAAGTAIFLRYTMNGHGWLQGLGLSNEVLVAYTKLPKRSV